MVNWASNYLSLDSLRDFSTYLQCKSAMCWRQQASMWSYAMLASASATEQINISQNHIVV